MKKFLPRAEKYTVSVCPINGIYVGDIDDDYPHHVYHGLAGLKDFLDDRSPGLATGELTREELVSACALEYGVYLGPAGRSIEPIPETVLDAHCLGFWISPNPDESHDFDKLESKVYLETGGPYGGPTIH